MRRVYPVLFNPNIGFEWGATLFKSTMRWRCTNRITLPRPHTRLIELRQDKIWKMKLSNRFYFPTIFFFLPLRLSNDENEVPWAHIVDKLHMISWMIRWRFCYSSPNVKPAPREKHQWRWEIWNLSTHARTHARTHTHIYIVIYVQLLWIYDIENFIFLSLQCWKVEFMEKIMIE